MDEASSTGADKANRKEYLIKRAEQVKCLASAPRLDMLDRLSAEGPMSVQELAHAIGMKPSALYRHLNIMVDAGLVEETGSRVVNRRTEKLYNTLSPNMRLTPELRNPEVRDLIQDVVAAITRQTERDFAEGQRRPDSVHAGPGRNLNFFRLLGAPDEATLAQINAHLDAIMTLLLKERKPGRPLVSLAWVMAPVRRIPNDETGNE